MREWWLEPSIVDRFAAAGPSDTPALPNGLVAHRVGRNRVWKVEAPDGGACFLKLCRGHGDYERQSHGLRHAAALAASTPGCLAPAILAADPARYLLVTKPLEGESVATIFTDAFRIDRNPWARPARYRPAIEALTAVAHWLRAFHLSLDQAPAEAYDHSASGSWQRTAAKLDAIEQRAGLAAEAPLWRHMVFEPPAAPAGLVFGDATLGNFFYDRGRVGAVDFEDLGTGEAARDQATLQRIIALAFSQPHYWHVPEALAAVDTERTPMHDCVALELDVNQLERLTRTSSVTAAWARRQARRRVVHGLTVLAGSGYLRSTGAEPGR